MSLESVKKDLKKYNKDKDIIILEDTSATVELAALALNTSPSSIAKTLAFKTENGAMVIVMAGDARIDNAKFKQEFHYKAKMLSPDETYSYTSHKIGGVCPFGLNDGVEVYLDESLKSHDIIYPACGSSNSAIKLTIEELEEYSNYLKWVDVCKNSEI